MYSKYREQDMKSSLERVSDYRGFSLKRFHLCTILCNHSNNYESK